MLVYSSSFSYGSVKGGAGGGDSYIFVFYLFISS